MPKRVDPRVKRTKKLLRQGLIELIKQKPVAEITVKELAEHVDINRGTFYKYYKDIPDLVSQLENQVARDFQVIVDKPVNDSVENYPIPLMNMLFDYIRANADICGVLLGNNGNKEFICTMKDIVRVRFLKNYKDIIKLDNSRLFEYFCAYVGDGCISLITKWIEMGMVEPSDEMAQLILHMILHPYKIMKK